jgi:two-component system NarL family response regulator
LGERHPGLAERVRSLLAAWFQTVVTVADERSLLETAERLRPEVVIADLSLARDGSVAWIRRLRDSCPEAKLLVLSVHDEPAVRRATLEAGAHGFVSKSFLAESLVALLESLLEVPQPRLRESGPGTGPARH